MLNHEEKTTLDDAVFCLTHILPPIIAKEKGAKYVWDVMQHMVKLAHTLDERCEILEYEKSLPTHDKTMRTPEANQEVKELQNGRTRRASHGKETCQ